MKRSFLLIVILVHYSSDIVGISIVYNIRIASTTEERKERYESVSTKPSILIGTYVNQTRRRYNAIDEMVNGGLLSYNYSFKPFFISLDGAFGNVVGEDLSLAKSNHTQADDLLFTTGYRHKVGSHLNLAYSFLFGIPTHKDYGLEYFQLGTGHVGSGVQLDGIYSLDAIKHSSIATAFRFVHFFDAMAPVTINEVKTRVNLNVGDFVDVLIAYRKKWRNHHTIECGYNPEFAFNIRACPTLPILPSNVIRSSFYATYRYIFLAHNNHPMGIALGFSYGFDNTPKDIGLKRILSTWFSYGINF